jgi:ribosomal protein S18 acetylase RimI-like enzyme
VTSVAVAANQRRTGVARALLTHIEHEARVRGKRFLGLYVSAENRGALRLYQSLGFQEVRLQRSLMSRFLFGAGRWIYMRKDLR